MPVRRLRVALVLATAVALAAGCGVPGVAPGDAVRPAEPAWHFPDADDLRRYADCDELQRDLAERAAAGVSPRLSGDLAEFDRADLSFASGPLEVGVRVPSAANVTEDGVDEPARWAVTGDLLVRPAGAELRVYDVSGRVPLARGVLDLQAAGFAADHLLLAGTRALLVGGERHEPTGAVVRSGPPPVYERNPLLEPPRYTMLALVDLADPDRPVLLGTARFQGGLVSARLTGLTARVVTADYGAVSDPLWRQVWDGSGAPVEVAPPACTDIRHTPGRSRPGMLMVETVNLARPDGLAAAATTGVVGATFAYNSTNRLYLGTSPIRPGDPVGIHAFEAGPAPETAYAGSGSIDGYVRGAWAMSERDGHLRVLVHDRPPPPWKPYERAGDKQAVPGHTRIEVLDAREGLSHVGRTASVLPGSFRTQVRWIDDLALVRGAKAVDPVDVIDLTNPQRPSVGGELSGAFRYLHPVGAGRVLGIGTLPGGRTEDGGPLDRGMQVAALDLRDPDSPHRDAFLDVGLAEPYVMYRPQNFAYDADSRIALLTAGLQTGKSCPADQFCISGGDEVPDRCRPLAACGITAAYVPTLFAVRMGTDGRVSESSRWTGMELDSLVPLRGGRVALMGWDRIVLVDAITLEPSGELVTRVSSGESDAHQLVEPKR